MKLRMLVSCLLMLLLAPPLWAQQEESAPDVSASEESEQYLDEKYVTDKLRLTLYKEPRGNSETLRLLTSGDLLFVMERNGPYSRVKTQDGMQGWVKNGFLVTVPTANIQLEQALQDIEALNRKIEKYSDTEAMVAQYESNLQTLGEQKLQSDQKVEQLQQQLLSQNQQQQQLQRQLDQVSHNEIDIETIFEVLKQLWYFVAAAVLLFFLIGLIIGKLVIETQVRKRFQGIKVW